MCPSVGAEGQQHATDEAILVEAKIGYSLRHALFKTFLNNGAVELALAPEQYSIHQTCC